MGPTGSVWPLMLSSPCEFLLQADPCSFCVRSALPAVWSRPSLSCTASPQLPGLWGCLLCAAKGTGLGVVHVKGTRIVTVLPHLSQLPPHPQHCIRVCRVSPVLFLASPWCQLSGLPGCRGSLRRPIAAHVLIPVKGSSEGQGH